MLVTNLRFFQTEDQPVYTSHSAINLQCPVIAKATKRLAREGNKDAGDAADTRIILYHHVYCTPDQIARQATYPRDNRWIKPTAVI